jgi:hypothetical protein
MTSQVRAADAASRTANPAYARCAVWTTCHSSVGILANVRSVTAMTVDADASFRTADYVSVCIVADAGARAAHAVDTDGSVRTAEYLPVGVAADAKSWTAGAIDAVGTFRAAEQAPGLAAHATGIVGALFADLEAFLSRCAGREVLRAEVGAVAIALSLRFWR